LAGDQWSVLELWSTKTFHPTAL